MNFSGFGRGWIPNPNCRPPTPVAAMCNKEFMQQEQFKQQANNLSKKPEEKSMHSSSWYCSISSEPAGRYVTSNVRLPSGQEHPSATSDNRGSKCSLKIKEASENETEYTFTFDCV